MDDRVDPVTSPLGRTFAAVVFDWDGTAVASRSASARAVRARLLRLSTLGVHAAVVSGTHVGNIDGQLAARPRGPGRLFLALNRGSELFEVGRGGPVLLHRRAETARVRSALDATARDVAGRLGSDGLQVEIVGHRLNRTKIDLLPQPRWRDPPKSQLADVLTEVTRVLAPTPHRSLAEVSALARAAAAGHGLPEARITSDGKHVEIGVTDKGDSMRAVLSLLDALGVAGELVLVVGDEFGSLAGLAGSDAHLLTGAEPGPLAVSVGVEPHGVPDGVRHLPGGPPVFLALLDEQLRRASDLRVPEVCRDPRWTVVERGVDPARHRVAETLFTLASDAVGWRGSTEEDAHIGEPLVTAAGVWAGDDVDDGLLEGPDLVDIELREPVHTDVRVLDLRTGVLHREEVGRERPLRSARFASAVEPAVFALRVEAETSRLAMPERAGADEDSWSCVSGDPGGLGALTRELRAHDGPTTSLQRLTAVDADADHPPDVRAARSRLDRASRTGFERLLCRQRAAWAVRWDRVGVHIPDDPRTELRLRFALFHLWNLTARAKELAVGARSVTGTGYAGHVFWDADAYVLPALVTIDPPSAAAMLEYRLRRLPAARDLARATGHAGARFPWESARDGHDVTPEHGYLGCEPVMIHTGQMEEHITADVAWAVAHHAAWTRPSGAHTRREVELIRDTARYWESRAVRYADGSGHLLDVIGPDEYHERVDDNAFTNVMARWNLRHAVRHAHAPAAERSRWAELAAALVDGHDEQTGRYEQFRGYFGLTPLLMSEVGAPPVAADVLLGREQISKSQLIKQPDVLMLHYLVPDEVAAGSLVPNLDFYAPRTAHGSSLSPAVMAHLHARAHDPDQARELLSLALATDLEDVGGTTAAGIHIAAAAGAWRAVVSGFLGARVLEGRLQLDPVLPEAWRAVEVRFHCLGADVRVEVGPRQVTVGATSPLTVTLADDCRLEVSTTGAARLERRRLP